jgi:hypothetical protein
MKGGKVYGSRGGVSEGVGAGKVVGIPQTEEDLEIVNGKKFSNAQRESMRAAAERYVCVRV